MLEELADAIGWSLRKSDGDPWSPSRHADAYVVPNSEVIAVEDVSDLRSEPDAVVYVTFDESPVLADGLVPAKVVESVEVIDTLTNPHTTMMPFASGAKAMAIDDLAALVAAELKELPRSYEE